MKELNEDFFPETLRAVERMIGKEFANLKTGVRRTRTGVINLSISADCRICQARVEAGRPAQGTDWTYKLMAELEEVALSHAKKHKLIMTPSRA